MGQLLRESHSSELREDFLVRGKSTRLVLRVDSFPIDNNIKNAAPALDQFAIDRKLRLYCIRQTGGLGCIVSLHAVRNRNLHFLFLLRFLQCADAPCRSP